VGIAAGTLSSIFIATPLLVDLRRREPELAAQAERVARRRAEEARGGGSGRRRAPEPEPGSPEDESGELIAAGPPSAPSYGTPPPRGQRHQPRRGRRSGKGHR
jgi:preprotein translocase subunit SecF